MNPVVSTLGVDKRKDLVKNVILGKAHDKRRHMLSLVD